MHYRATSLTSDVPQTSCSALVMMIELRDPSCHSMMMPFKKNAFGHLIEGLVQWPSDRSFLYPALIVFLSFSPSFSHILSLSLLAVFISLHLFCLLLLLYHVSPVYLWTTIITYSTWSTACMSCSILSLISELIIERFRVVDQEDECLGRDWGCIEWVDGYLQCILFSGWCL